MFESGEDALKEAAKGPLEEIIAVLPTLVEEVDDSQGCKDVITNELEVAQLGMNDDTSEIDGSKANGKDLDMDQIGGGKKIGKGVVLTGMCSKKRNVQMLSTPRKRPTSKNEVRIGDGLVPKNQGKEKGLLAGPKPPKPAA